MFTKRHYKAIAKIVKKSTQFPSPDYKEVFAEGLVAGGKRTAHGLADYFAADNPLFDRAKFLAACGIAL